MDARRLREETRKEHEATEAVMPLGGEHFDLALYRRTLEMLYPLVTSWERWAERHAPVDLQDLVHRRRRSPFLKADLEMLQGKQSLGDAIHWGNSHAGQPGAACSRASFLGTLYVMEGSTLGGRFIARQVESQLGFAPGHGNAYFRGHEEATGSLWKEVLAQIAAIPEECAEVTIDAARRAFLTFRQELISQMEPAVTDREQNGIQTAN